MPTFDVEKALDQIEGDVETLSMLVSTFKRVAPQQIEEMCTAIKEADAEKLAKVAHCFKGSLSLFAAQAATGIVLQLELDAREADFVNAKQTLAELETECTRLGCDLASFLHSIE